MKAIFLNIFILFFCFAVRSQAPEKIISYTLDSFYHYNSADTSMTSWELINNLWIATAIITKNKGDIVYSKIIFGGTYQVAKDRFFAFIKRQQRKTKFKMGNYFISKMADNIIFY